PSLKTATAPGLEEMQVSSNFKKAGQREKVGASHVTCPYFASVMGLVRALSTCIQPLHRDHGTCGVVYLVIQSMEHRQH
ncbi:hypothetical protein MPDQ_002136, partial [Monascus purpureus]